MSMDPDTFEGMSTPRDSYAPWILYDHKTRRYVEELDCDGLVRPARAATGDQHNRSRRALFFDTFEEASRFCGQFGLFFQGYMPVKLGRLELMRPPRASTPAVRFKHG